MRERLRKLANLSLYWRVVIRPNRWRVSALLLLGLLGSISEVAVLGITVPILDVVAHPEMVEHHRTTLWISHWLTRTGYTSTSSTILFALILLASVLFLLRGAFTTAEQYWSAWISLRIKQDTRANLFQRTLRTPYEQLTAQSRGANINDVVQPSDAIFVSVKGMGIFLTGILSILLLGGLMLYLSRLATLLIVLFAGFGTFTMRRILGRLSASRGHTVYNIIQSEAKMEVDVIDGIRVVKSGVLEQELSSQHKKLLESEIPPSMEITIFRNAPIFINELIAFVIIAGLGALTFLWPRTGLTFSTLVAMLLALRRLSPVISGMNATTVELGKWRRGLEILEKVTKRPLERMSGKPVGAVQEIALDHITFCYSTKRENALNDFSMRLRKGCVTALVGSTGSGKSTVANLLLGFYGPQKGNLLVDSHPLEDLDLLSWRRHIGYVSQDVFLFNASIEENISLWDPAVSLGRVRDVARIAQLDEFIMSLPEQYGTVVGDRGLRLSGGQCQRVAIARALLRAPQILILDEATSALDNLTEKAVYHAIEVMHHQAIVLVIAHRLSTVKDADEILVLEKGRVVETGRHDELLRREQGAYARLYSNEVGVVS